MTGRDSFESLWDRATPVGPLLDLRSEVLLAAADRFEAGCPDAGGDLDLCTCHAAEPLRRMADNPNEMGTGPNKGDLKRGDIEWVVPPPVPESDTPPEETPLPLVVSRFDIAMEPAPEEEPVLTIGCIAEDGRPVALLLDPETRQKVGRWIGHRDTP